MISRLKFMLSLLVSPVGWKPRKNKDEEEKPMPKFFKEYISKLNKDEIEELYTWLDTEPKALLILLDVVGARGKELE